MSTPTIIDIKTSVTTRSITGGSGYAGSSVYDSCLSYTKLHPIVETVTYCKAFYTFDEAVKDVQSQKDTLLHENKL